MIYLKEFATAQDYEAVKNNLPKPNVSLITDGSVVEYIKGEPTPPAETRLVCKYNVVSTSKATYLLNKTNNISAIEIDGQGLQEVVRTYTFDTTGEHTVKFTLTDSTKIAYETFQDTDKLVSVIIPNGVTTIEDYAFKETSISSVTIPNSVTTIGNSAFDYCSHITSITLSDNVTTIGTSAFEGTGIKTFVIPNGVTVINSNCFAQTSLSSVTIHEGVTYIGSQAFAMCRSLSSITIPSTVTSISYAFEDTPNLKDITCLAETAPILEYSLGMDMSPTGTLHVKSTSSGWEDEGSWMEALPNGWILDKSL